MIDIFIPGMPKPLPRPRFRNVPASKDGNRPAFIMTYNPPGEWNEWKAKVEAAIRRALLTVPGKDLFRDEDVIQAELVFVMKHTSSAIDPVYHGIKPDLDNLVKLVMDAATDAKVFYDDSRVARIVCEKRYPKDKKEETGVYLTLRRGPGQVELTSVVAAARAQPGSAPDESGLDSH